MDFNFRAPSPMFKEISRLESPLFFDDFKVDVNISPSRFFTTTPPLWSPTKSLQTEESPTKSFLTNESPTFNCFVDNIQPNGLIPFKPQVVKLEGNNNNNMTNNNKLEDNQSSQTRLMLESKGGAFEKFNNPIDMMANNQIMGNNGGSFVKYENMNTNNTPNNYSNNNNINNNNNLNINRMGGAFSKFDNNNNMEMNKQPQQPNQKMGMNTNIPFHPNPRNVPINNMKNLPNNIPNNNPNNNGINFAKFDNLPIYNQLIQNNNNFNNNNNQMYGNMPHQDTTTFVKFESVTSNLNNNNNMNNNMMNMNYMNNNNFPNHPHNNNINLPPNNNCINNNISTSKNIPPPKKTRGRKPQNKDDPSVEKPPTKKQKSKKEKDDLNKDKSIKPKFTTELTPTALETIHKKRTQDLQSPTFTDDGHLKSRVKEKKEVPDKIQCLGSSKKKGTQCKNAALLEYIGPRPLYCAEHIEEDKNTLHGKCKCPYFKEKGDGKPCKQIILKELVMCYRHFDEVLPTLTLEKARKQRTLVQEMIKKLRQDSKVFLKTNIDLYQRKSKLLPKYIKLDGILAKFISEREKLESN